jgi:site-specific recombinase XerD
MKKADVEKLIQDFCDHKRECGCSSRTVNTTLFMLKTFFKINGFKGNEKLEVDSYYQPVRARTREEYILTLDEARRMTNVSGSLRERAIILFMVSTGLARESLHARLLLRYRKYETREG